jgi:alcohol dehydrogenase
LRLLTVLTHSMGDCCVKAGWILGHTNDGSQAEYVRIKYADTSLYHVPQGVDERTLLVFSDILPTGLEVGVFRGRSHLAALSQS